MVPEYGARGARSKDVGKDEAVDPGLRRCCPIQGERWHLPLFSNGMRLDFLPRLMVLTDWMRNRELLYGLLGANSESDAMHEFTPK